MKFKNINTGLTWHITEREHQKRLLNDKNYEQVVNNKVSENETILTNFSELKWQDLRSLATEKGVNIHGKKREEIEKELVELGDE